MKKNDPLEKLMMDDDTQHFVNQARKNALAEGKRGLESYKEYVRQNRVAQEESILTEIIQGLETEAGWIVQMSKEKNIMELLLEDIKEFEPYEESSLSARGRVLLAKTLYDLLVELKNITLIN